MNSTNLTIPTYISKKDIKGDGISLVRMLITPEIAAFWLKTYNLSNRPLNASHVGFLASQMEKNQWIEGNGNTISFNTAGVLNDGQHRLAAIVKTGKTFTFSVIVGVNPDAFKITDTGRVRGAGDVLSIAGYKYGNSLAAAIKFILNFNNKKYYSLSSGGEKNSNTKPTNTDILDFAAKEIETLKPMVLNTLKYHKSGDKLLPSAQLIGLLYILSKKDYKAADKFIFKLATGSNIEHGSPLYVLRKKLRISKESMTAGLSGKAKLLFILRTWNAIRKGKTITHFKYYKNKSKMPKIV